MKRTRICLIFSAFTVLLGCSSDKEPAPPASQTSSALTYYDDALPIFAEHCVTCHQDGGIAPFALNDYGQARLHAGEIFDATQQRAMPPWSATSDGTCQTFSHNLALSDAELKTVAGWVDGGMVEGTPRSVDIPSLPTLGDATEFSTPKFSPVAQGGDLAEFDEYRCFLMDDSVTDPAFITGYEVVPGTPSVIHHVLAMVVDPDAPADMPGTTNGELMASLDADSPDRDGWPCFGMAGDGVAVESVPVVWAPGQGVVEYPGESGVPLLPHHRVVLQVHYNLADNPGTIVDRSTVRLRLVPSVKNVGVFVLHDALLDSLYSDSPQALEPGKSSVKVSWQQPLGDYFGTTPNVKLYGVMPHMHQRGHRYRMSLGTSNDLGCAIDVQSWDFHWQRMYFYEHPLSITSSSEVQVTCDYDTSADTAPIMPGWGTRNEMCLATMYFTVPADEF
jgi:hypothetical protein